MRSLNTADIHLTSNVADEYRWSVFKWLATRADAEKVDFICINGDLTEHKDNHSGALLNRVVDEITALAKVAPVHVNMGNHDYIDPQSPFFNFLDQIKNVYFYREVSEVDMHGSLVLFLPHTRHHRRDWEKVDFKKYDLIYTHQAFTGAKLANEAKMIDGISPDIFGDTEATIIAGDIHVPQEIRRGENLSAIFYCGSPHPIDFGDDFKPRVLLLLEDQADFDSRKPFSLVKPITRHTVRKVHLTVNTLEELEREAKDLEEGDIVKVTILLTRSEFGSWPQIRQDIEKLLAFRGLDYRGAQLKESVRRRIGVDATVRASMTPADVLKRFCESRQIDGPMLDFGIQLLG